MISYTRNRREWGRVTPSCIALILLYMPLIVTYSIHCLPIVPILIFFFSCFIDPSFYEWVYGEQLFNHFHVISFILDLLNFSDFSYWVSSYRFLQTTNGKVIVFPTVWAVFPMLDKHDTHASCCTSYTSTHFLKFCSNSLASFHIFFYLSRRVIPQCVNFVPCSYWSPLHGLY